MQKLPRVTASVCKSFPVQKHLCAKAAVCNHNPVSGRLCVKVALCESFSFEELAVRKSFCVSNALCAEASVEICVV